MEHKDDVFMEEASARKDEGCIGRLTDAPLTSSAITAWDLFAAAWIIRGSANDSAADKADRIMKLRKERL